MRETCIRRNRKSKKYCTLIRHFYHLAAVIASQAFTIFERSICVSYEFKHQSRMRSTRADLERGKGGGGRHPSDKHRKNLSVWREEKKASYSSHLKFAIDSRSSDRSRAVSKYRGIGLTSFTNHTDFLRSIDVERSSIHSPVWGRPVNEIYNMPAHNRDVNFGPSRWRYVPDAFFMRSWARVECKRSSAISVWSAADSETVMNARTASFFSLSRAPAWRAIKHFVMQMFRNNNSTLPISQACSLWAINRMNRLFADEVDRVCSEEEEKNRRILSKTNEIWRTERIGAAYY